MSKSDDLISRQTAIEEVCNMMRECFGADDEILDALKITLNELTAIYPEPKTGRWLPDNRPDDGFWVCSACKFPSEAFAANVIYKFCPSCGAKMEGSE